MLKKTNCALQKAGSQEAPSTATCSSFEFVWGYCTMVVAETIVNEIVGAILKYLTAR